MLKWLNYLHQLLCTSYHLIPTCEVVQYLHAFADVHSYHLIPTCEVVQYLHAFADVHDDNVFCHWLNVRPI